MSFAHRINNIIHFGLPGMLMAAALAAVPAAAGTQPIVPGELPPQVTPWTPMPAPQPGEEAAGPAAPALSTTVWTAIGPAPLSAGNHVALESPITILPAAAPLGTLPRRLQLVPPLVDL